MTSEAPVLADYGGASVERIVPTLLRGSGASWLPPCVEGASTVVVLVVDGLGASQLAEHAGEAPGLAALPGRSITTVVPSTTAAALTSMTTGLPPAAHGITGYRALVGPGVMNMLTWRMPEGRRPPDPSDVQRSEPFAGRPVAVVTRAEFADTAFTRAHLRGARFHGWHTLSTLVEKCRELATAGESLVWAYYNGLDAVAHEFGLYDGYYARELRAVDRLVADLIDALPESSALLVTSDHGQVHLEASDWIEVPDLVPLVTCMAGDGRFRYLHARPGAVADLLEAARAVAGSRAWVRSRKEVLAEGWLGPTVAGPVAGRIGDVVMAARAGVAFVDPALRVEARLRSGHGSLTADEMLVPLLGARGTARAASLPGRPGRRSVK